MIVLDISDITLPKLVSQHPINKLVIQSEDVLVDKRGHIYVTDKNYGLHTLRCTIIEYCRDDQSLSELADFL